MTKAQEIKALAQLREIAVDKDSYICEFLRPIYLDQMIENIQNDHPVGHLVPLVHSSKLADMKTRADEAISKLETIRQDTRKYDKEQMTEVAKLLLEASDAGESRLISIEFANEMASALIGLTEVIQINLKNRYALTEVQVSYLNSRLEE